MGAAGQPARQERRWTDDNKEKLKTLWGEGVGIRQIAVECGKTPTAVKNMRDVLKLTPRQAPPPPRMDPVWPDHKRDKFRQLWLKGTSIKRMADIFGISEHGIKANRKRFGLEPRGSRYDATVKRAAILVVLPEKLKDKAARMAMVEGVSLNRWITRAVEIRAS